MAQFVKRRVANPAPSVLALVNKTRRKNMATPKKKKSSSKSRSTAAKSTPRRQTKPRHHNPPKPKRASSKKSHTKPRSSRPRRHNPLMSGDGGQILSFAGAGLGLGIAQPLVSNAVGRFLPFGQYNGPILTFGTGWLLSKLFEMLRFTKPLARPTFILGASTAVIQITQPLVRNLIGGGGAAAPPLMQGPRGYNQRGQGMGAIGAVTGTPPRLVPLPPGPPANGGRKGGMGAIGAVPGRFRR
jgi:hypothetical protein